MTDKLLTDNALAAKAITLKQAQLLEYYIDAQLEDEEADSFDIPEHLKAIYDISIHHLFDGRKLH